MNTEDVLRTRLQSSATTIPLRPLDHEAVLNRARRARRSHLTLLAAGTAACLAIAALGVARLWPDSPRGERITRPVAPATPLSGEQAQDLVDRFVTRLQDGDVEGSWALLTPGARDRAGSRTALRDTMRSLASSLSWIPGPEIDVSVTSLTTGVGERHVATFTAPVEGGSALLQPLVVEIVDGEPLVDIPSVDLRRAISLEPEVPELFACSAANCDPRNLWPEIRDGDTFSVLLTPEEEVRDVWFAVGGDAWVARGEVTDAGEAARAQATLDGDMVPAGVNVYVVAIETMDGRLETYGYRVVYAAS